MAIISSLFGREKTSRITGKWAKRIKWLWKKNQIWEVVMKVNEYIFNVFGSLNLKMGEKEKQKFVIYENN